MEEFVRAFASDSRTVILFGLMLLDMGFGVIAALVTRSFGLRKFGTWLNTNALPYLGGYLLVYIVSAIGLQDLLDQYPGFQGFLPGIAATVGFLPGMAALVDSIMRNVNKIRSGQPTPPPQVMTGPVEIKPVDTSTVSIQQQTTTDTTVRDDELRDGGL